MSSRYATSTSKDGYKWSSSYRSGGAGEVSTSKQKLSSGSTSRITGYGTSATKRHSRSKSVDDVLRGSSQGSAKRASTFGVETSSMTKHSSLQGNDVNVRGNNYRRSNTCDGDHRMNSTDEDFLCTNTSKKMLVEESGADDRTVKSKYKIVGRITRSPSPDQKYCKQQACAVESSCFDPHNRSGGELNVCVARGSNNERGGGKIAKDTYACNSHDESLVDRYNIRNVSNSRRYDGDRRDNAVGSYPKSGSYHHGYRSNNGIQTSDYNKRGYRSDGDQDDNRRGVGGGVGSSRLPGDAGFNDSYGEGIDRKGSYGDRNDRDGPRYRNRSPEFDGYRGLNGGRNYAPRGRSPGYGSRGMNNRDDGEYRNGPGDRGYNDRDNREYGPGDREYGPNDEGYKGRDDRGYKKERPYGGRDASDGRDTSGDRCGRSPARQLPSTTGSRYSSPYRNRPYSKGRSPKYRRPYTRGLQIKRSRSLNDIGDQSMSPSRLPNIYGRGQAAGATGVFPVCKRFPNCSVCTIDIPRQSESVR